MSDIKTNKISNKKENWRSTKTTLIISKIFQEIIDDNLADKHNLELVQKQKRYSFTAKKSPAISLSAFLERIFRYVHMEESTLISALIYIDRLSELSDIVLTAQNIHR